MNLYIVINHTEKRKKNEIKAQIPLKRRLIGLLTLMFAGSIEFVAGHAHERWRQSSKSRIFYAIFFQTLTKRMLILPTVIKSQQFHSNSFTLQALLKFNVQKNFKIHASSVRKSNGCLSNIFAIHGATLECSKIYVSSHRVENPLSLSELK